MRVYLDAAPVIYLVERVAPFHTAVRSYLASSLVTLVASEITRLESRTKPMRDNQPATLADFDAFFATAVSEIVPLDRLVVDTATRIRAVHGFRTPDALHLAAAVQSRCDAFLTNDGRLVRFSGIQVVVVDSLKS